jgi:tetratricopeptide (TPR) repeat protein
VGSDEDTNADSPRGEVCAEEWWVEILDPDEVDDWVSPARPPRTDRPMPDALPKQSCDGVEPDAVDPGPAAPEAMLESAEYRAWQLSHGPLGEHMTALTRAADEEDWDAVTMLAVALLARTAPDFDGTVPHMALTYAGTQLLRSLAARASTLGELAQLARPLQEALEGILGDASRDMRQPLARAVRPARAAAALDASSSSDLASLAAAVRRAGNPPIAVEASTLAIARDGRNQAGYIARARAHITLERFDNAESDLDAALSLEDSEYHATTRTRLLVLTGQVNQALALAAETFARWPGRETATAWAAAARDAGDEEAYRAAAAAAAELPVRDRLTLEQLERRALAWASSVGGVWW